MTTALDIRDRHDLAMLEMLRSVDPRFSKAAFQALTHGYGVNQGDVGIDFFGDDVFVQGREDAPGHIGATATSVKFTTLEGQKEITFRGVFRIKGKSDAPVSAPGDGGRAVICKKTRQVLGALVSSRSDDNVAYVIPARLMLA